MKSFKRGTLLSALVMAVGISATPSWAADEPIRLGAIHILSGSAANYGKFARQGIDLAIDEINDSGGVMGRDLELVIEDSQGKASTAIQAARKLVYQDQVSGLLGLDSSGVAQGLVPIMPELKKPLIITHAATPDATGSLCNAYTYRISNNVAQNMNALASVAAETGAKRWTTIGPDYAFGHQSWEYFGNALKKINPDVELLKDTAFPRFGAEDFTPFINGVMAAKPDGVLISVWGGDLVNFVRQANNLGFFEKDMQIIFTVGAATEVLSALGEQMPEGVWLSTRYWYKAFDNEQNKHFVAAYKDRYGVPPSYNAEGAYAAVYAYKKAIEKAGSADDGDKIAAALDGMSLDAPNGTITFRKGDHQALVGPNVGRAGAMDEEDGIRDLEDLRLFDGEKISRSVAETGCKL
ncbi:ABC transporter substrate-binding protein [Alloalcanivorax mobilis]|uniref:ABC transporter substrate-binding protein n=1 Tax=Alloalcanivorax mobilis TaxID=2019569 RepID=UPI000C770F00|nr:ABC transporter substrate-binding protein [Alloalcanivorax mobilis]